MELDNRIKSKNDILTSFDVKDAGQFLGQEGYFSDCFDHYRCLAYRKYGILTEIKDSDCPFKEGNNEYWRFFIPESRLKSVEKIDEISALKYKVEKLEKNLIELKQELNNQKIIYNPFAPWTNCCNSIMYSDGFNPQANCCSSK
jgi:hypothetical protein